MFLTKVDFLREENETDLNIRMRAFFHSMECFLSFSGKKVSFVLFNISIYWWGF